MLMRFQERMAEFHCNGTVLECPVSTVYHKTSVPAVWKFMMFLNTTLPCFLPFMCYLEVL